MGNLCAWAWHSGGFVLDLITIKMVLRSRWWVSTGLVDFTGLPLCRVCVFNVGSKITNLGLRPLILESSANEVSFDTPNTEASVSYIKIEHANDTYALQYLHRKSETAIYSALFPVLPLVLDCANASWFVCLDCVFQSSHERVPFFQRHATCSFHLNPRWNWSHQHWLHKHAYFRSLPPYLLACFFFLPWCELGGSARIDLWGELLILRGLLLLSSSLVVSPDMDSESVSPCFMHLLPLTLSSGTTSRPYLSSSNAVGGSTDRFQLGALGR